MADAKPVEPVYIAIADAFVALDVSRTTGYGLIRRGILKTTKIGRSTKTRPEWLRQAADALDAESASAA